MDIICSIAYDPITDEHNLLNDSDNLELRELIDMMVTKQVYSSIPK